MKIELCLSGDCDVDVCINGRKKQYAPSDTYSISVEESKADVEIKQASPKLHWYLLPLYILVSVCFIPFMLGGDEPLSSIPLLCPYRKKASFSVIGSDSRRISLNSQKSNIDASGNCHKGVLHIEGIDDHLISYEERLDPTSFSSAYIQFLSLLLLPITALAVIFAILLFAGSAPPPLLGIIIVGIVMGAFSFLAFFKALAEKKKLKGIYEALPDAASTSHQ